MNFQIFNYSKSQFLTLISSATGTIMYSFFSLKHEKMIMYNNNKYDPIQKRNNFQSRICYTLGWSFETLHYIVVSTSSFMTMRNKHFINYFSLFFSAKQAAHSATSLIYLEISNTLQTDQCRALKDVLLRNPRFRIKLILRRTRIFLHNWHKLYKEVLNDCFLTK